MMKIEKISIIGGYGRDGKAEEIKRVDFYMGDIISIVGPTGSGKTALINDIELYADGNTPSKRKVLINDQPVPEEFSLNPSQHPIALISQHTNFLSDLPVGEFLEIHARIRRSENAASIVGETLDFANQLTGEAIDPRSSMTELSGGQTRSLLIADAVIIGNAPIILLDEIENAGIHKRKVLELLKKYKKIFIFVTHDPAIALSSKLRIIMGKGAMQKLVETGEDEQLAASKLQAIDGVMLDFRKLMRLGKEIGNEEVEDRIKQLVNPGKPPEIK
ncbi:MAG: ATP-binding cassette domain-containing protein [Patescibacteria group bacterium]|nr:ATP-binding cassette domain-containing protein [Patescibacteria group bacterium]